MPNEKFRMDFDGTNWEPKQSGGGNPTEEFTPDTETVEIYKTKDSDEKYMTCVKVVGTGICYNVGNDDKFYMVQDSNWLVCKQPNSNHPFDTMTCPSASPDTTLEIGEGSVWVNIGGRWYKVG